MSPHRRRTARSLTAALLAAAGLGLGAAPALAADPLLAPESECGGLISHSAPAGVQQQAVACLINHARRTAGVAQLRPSARLARSARAKVALMIRCDSLSHTACGTAFTHTMRQNGRAPLAAGENIGAGQSTAAAPRAIMAAWLASPSHRANLLDPEWRTQGLSVRAGVTFETVTDSAVWVSHFGL
jgi:uncharacterized protein YkwD